MNIKKNNYRMKGICDNCGAKEEFKIPFGEMVEEYLNKNEFECDKCGAKNQAAIFCPEGGNKNEH